MATGKKEEKKRVLRRKLLAMTDIPRHREEQSDVAIPLGLLHFVRNDGEGNGNDGEEIASIFSKASVFLGLML